jgi:hypothetical protein
MAQQEFNSHVIARKIPVQFRMKGLNTMTNRTQKQEMEDVISFAAEALGRIRENRPKPEWNWWNSGALLNGDKINQWEEDCRSLDTSVTKSRELLNNHGEYDGRTVDYVRSLIHETVRLENRYCGVK